MTTPMDPEDKFHRFYHEHLVSTERVVTVKHEWLPAYDGLNGGSVQIKVFSDGKITGIWSGTVRAILHLMNKCTWTHTFPNGDKWLAKRKNNREDIGWGKDIWTYTTLTIREKRQGCQTYSGDRHSTPKGVCITPREWSSIVELAQQWLKEDDAYDIECQKRDAEKAEKIRTGAIKIEEAKI